jgi:hypothetical protein
MALPILRPRYANAVALYIDRVPGSGTRHRLRTERVFVKDGAWVVRRNGRLVRLADQQPQPDALELQDSTVESGRHEWWSDRASFLRANGIDPFSREAEAV